MTNQASGSFEITLTPQPLSKNGEDAKIGRMSIEKHFEGDLLGISNGEMLAAGSNVAGSAVYVAIEKISGTLHGRSGSFSLHHK